MTYMTRREPCGFNLRPLGQAAMPEASLARKGCGNGRGERSGAHAFQLRYEIAPDAGLRLEVA